MKSNKTELVMGMNLSESTTVFEEVSVTLPASHVGNRVKVELVEESPELPENSVPLGTVYEIDVEGLTDEATEIPVKISFDTGFEQADEDKALVIMHYDEENELWIPTLTVEDESGRSYTYTKDFSLYTLVLYGETLEVKDFSPGVNGLTFVNYPEVLRNADNHLSDFDTTGNEDGCCFGMTITSLELYNEKLPRDPEFDFDVNKEAILYKLVRFEVETTDGKMEIDLDPFFYKPRVTCEAILEAVFNEHGRQLLTDIEATLEFLVLAPSRISLSITQIDEILYSLVLGRPIEVGIFSLPFLKNAHSIVVYGAEIKPFGIDFAIYDPNYPGVTKTLSVIEPFWIMGDYGKEYDFLLADSLKTVAGSHATRQELEEMLDNAYIPRFKGMYYNINDNSIWMSLWNHYRPDRPTPSSINIMRKENSSYSLLKTIDDKGTTQIHTDVNVEPNKTYTYRIDRIDGGESPEYSIETKVFNVDPVSGSNVSKDGFTISMDLPAGIYRAYKNYSDTQIDHLKSGGNTISFSATECQQYFSNGTVNLKILGVFDSSFVTRDVIYYLTDPPTVTKVSGPNGEISENSSTFSWTGSDPDGTITKYEYREDEGSWESNGTSTSYTWSGYSIGEHTFEVRAQDDEGAYSNIIIWNFTYAAVEEVPYITWQKCLGGSGLDDGLSIQQTSDGGYIVSGYTGSIDGDVSGNHGDLDFWVVKLSSTGNLQWQKCLGGSSLDDARSIQQTSDGGYVVAGYAHSNDGDVSGNHGNAVDFWVVKLSSTGSLQWQKCLGGSGWDFAHSIRQTSDGGYIVLGSTGSNDGDVSGNHGNYDLWVVKLSSTGNLQWQKCLGGSGQEEGLSIQQTSDGGYVVAGCAHSNDGDVSGNHGNFDFWVLKLTNTGSLQWQKCLGGSGDDGVGSIQQTSDGGYIVAGYTNSNDGDVSGNHANFDFWVVKLSSTGNLQWQKCLGGSGDDGVGSIQQTSDGGYIVAGVTWSNDGDVSGNHGVLDFWVVKLSSMGSLQWQKCLGGSSLDEAHSIQQTDDGGYIVLGSTGSNDGDVSGNHGDSDFWVVKLD